MSDLQDKADAILARAETERFERMRAAHRELYDALCEARAMLRDDYPDSSLAAGNWPTVKPIAEKWDALLARIDGGGQ